VKQRCVLINPWICDFAAANLWSRPLGLLKLAEYLSRFDLDMKLIDCTDMFKQKRYGTGKYPKEIIEKPKILKEIPRYYARYGISAEDFKRILKSHLPCDLILITSIMSYWYTGVQEVISVIKAMSPDTPVLLGGIYATLFHSHAIKNSGADYIYKGHLIKNNADILSERAELPRPCNRETAGRFSNSDLETVITNFGCKLKKTEHPKPYYNLGLYQQYPFAPLLTSSGCPFKCSYCASSILFDGFLQREPSDVIDEIMTLYGLGVRDFVFYDDALFFEADSHMKIILKELISLELKTRFHCPNGVHARFIDDELAYLMKQTGFTTLRLGLETISEERQARTGGKIFNDDFAYAVRVLRKYGFTKEHIGAYLMYGLPGQGLAEVRDGVSFLKGLDVRVHLTEFSPIPGTPCWEELKQKGVISDDIDPLLTNNTVFSFLFSGYDRKALSKLKLDVKEYNNL
jgi:radical SAM superfamily enzyme YgiQ (UPF0313 family)